MSELVQRHLEAMAEEIQEMRRTDLFTVEETKLILKKRKECEYKINGVIKNLQDYKDYIIFEKSLLKGIRIRRDKHKIYDRKSSIEGKMRKRIRTLYEIALQRFSDDFSFHRAYFKFCKQSNFIGPATQAVNNMVQKFSHNPDVWQLVAAFYAYDRNEMNSALKVLLKGLTIHKTCQNLYLEAIEYEFYKLTHRDKDDSTEPEAAKNLCCEKIITYLKAIFENIDDYNFLIKLLDVISNHSFTKPAQNVIIEKLMSSYSQEELVWHTLAQREKNGQHYGDTNESSQISTKTCLTSCINTYEEGLKKVPDSKKSALWSLYIDCLISLQQDGKVANVTKTFALKRALEQADSEKHLTEKYYIVWLEFLTEDEAIKVLEKATTTSLPQSVELWKMWLKFTIIKENIQEMNRVFKLGVVTLKEKALPLWLSFIRFNCLMSSDDIVDSIYRDGIKQPKEISEVLKPKYIEWLAVAKGISEARKSYSLLARETPYCKDLHITMCKIESIEIDYDFEFWEQALVLACEQFGKEDVDVWIQYIQFFINFNRTESIGDKVQRIYNDAQKKLSPLLLSYFQEKFDNAVASI